MPKDTQENKMEKNLRILIYSNIAILILVVYIAISLTSQQGSLDSGAQQVGVPEQALKQYKGKVIDSDDAVLGNESATVEIIEFSDIQCPFCGVAYREIVPVIKSQYIETGKVKFVYKHYPLDFHENAVPSAEASECAKEQGKFWEFHDAIFESDTLDRDTYISIARTLGLNITQFENCIDTNKYAQRIIDDQRAGELAGVTGTPGFLVGSESKGYKLISGARLSTIEQEVEKLI